MSVFPVRNANERRSGTPNIGPTGSARGDACACVKNDRARAKGNALERGSTISGRNLSTLYKRPLPVPLPLPLPLPIGYNMIRLGANHEAIRLNKIWYGSLNHLERQIVQSGVELLGDK